LLHFYRLTGKNFEYCYNIETSSTLNESDIETLQWLLSETFEPGNFNIKSLLNTGEYKKTSSVTEIGPRLNFETAFSTNAVAICHACGINKITRLERSRRYLRSEQESSDNDKFIEENHDRMTELVYDRMLESFQTGIKPEEVYMIPLLSKGADALNEINKKYGLGFDAWDIDFYFRLFTEDFKRNPTNVECYQLSQANSEHSRHWFFKGRLIIDGRPMPLTLMEVIKSTLAANPSNSLIAFTDNSSAIKGYDILTIIPSNPGFFSAFNSAKVRRHIIFTAETHNFPSGVAPFPGAETGTGGRIRDVQGTGRGGHVIAGTAGYATGNLNIAGYPIEGENVSFTYPSNLAAPLRVMIEESNGASDYGNKFGEPLIQGFTRTFGLRLPNGERKEWVKPIMFTGGIGQIDDCNIEKQSPAKGMFIIQVGGPAYRIGLGGGSASSLIQGENRQDLDFNAVQRGNAEMEQKLNRVVRACIEMGEDNPILSAHDQGAGGPCNVLTEITDPAGGIIEIRKIAVGDRTMSVLEIWVAEYQERDAFLILPQNLEKFQNICLREKVNCEVLGEITQNGKIVVHDSLDNTCPVDLDLSKILSNIPQKEFDLKRTGVLLEPLKIPQYLKLEEAIENVFRLPSVGSKGFLVRKVDRSVTGLVARQQCCGPLGLPVSDVSIVAQSHFGSTGAAMSIGEQPLKILINPQAGARMSAAEALTNMVWAKISSLSDIKCSVNWMWPAKLPGEGAALWDCAESLVQFMKFMGIAADGGKDSVSMAARVEKETVKSPGEVVVSAYVTVNNINKAVTPDIKCPGESMLIFIDISNGKNRLGGSAFAQTLGQTGDECPDADDPGLLKNAFYAIQEMIDKDLILSGHDRSDGGLITAVSEMVMSGNCGAEIDLMANAGASAKAGASANVQENSDTGNGKGSILAKLFSEELGLLIEYMPVKQQDILAIIKKFGLPHIFIGKTLKDKKLIINNEGNLVCSMETGILLKWWESTSDELEKHQMNPVYALKQAASHIRKGPEYNISFIPEITHPEIIERPVKPRVAIIREEGSNGDREMASAFYLAGFEPWDITMTDLLAKQVSLKDFRGAVFVGGFSYADVLDSAKGWAGIIKFNPGLSYMFDEFYERPDTFSLGVCNGCQLLSLLGWVPFKGIPEINQPRFISNPSGRFESRWATVKILKSPSIMFSGMEETVFGIWVAHREGHMYCHDKEIFKRATENNLMPVIYVDDTGNAAGEDAYPFNPNSSPGGYTAICSEDGRHLAMMPHPERSFLLWQMPWLPENLKKELKASPWLKMFQNARKWCEVK
jgi:phosphoribosylformylglycinamidine synthase